MFDRLVASRNCITDRTGVPSSTVALLTHAGVCAAAVLGTLRLHRVPMRLVIGFTLRPTR